MYKYIFARFIRRRASTRKSHFAYTSVSSTESASRRRRQQQLFSLFSFSVSLSALCSEDESVTHNIKTNFFYFLFICWVNQVLCQCTSRSGYIRSKVEFFLNLFLGSRKKCSFFARRTKKCGKNQVAGKHLFDLIWKLHSFFFTFICFHFFSSFSLYVVDAPAPFSSLRLKPLRAKKYCYPFVFFFFSRESTSYLIFWRLANEKCLFLETPDCFSRFLDKHIHSTTEWWLNECFTICFEDTFR